jgi:hypothetical protein
MKDFLTGLLTVIISAGFITFNLVPIGTSQNILVIILQYIGAGVMLLAILALAICLIYCLGKHMNGPRV